MDIVDFFQSIFSFPIGEDMVKAALIRRNIDAEHLYFDELEPKDIDLITADILVMLSRASQGYSNKTGSSDFSMTLAGNKVLLADRRAMRYEADAIYRKHNELEKVSHARTVINI